MSDSRIKSYQFPKEYQIASTALLDNDDRIAVGYQEHSDKCFLFHATLNETFIYPINLNCGRTWPKLLPLRDNKHILVWNHYGSEIAIFNLELKQQLGCCSLSNGHRVNQIAELQDGKHIVVALLHHNVLQIWNIEQKESPRLSSQQTNEHNLHSLIATRDGKNVIASYTSGNIYLWGWQHNSLNMLTVVSPWLGNFKWSNLAVTTRGILFGSNLDGQIFVWNASDPSHPKPIYSEGGGSGHYAIWDLAVSPDDNYLASYHHQTSTDHGKLILWKISDKNTLYMTKEIALKKDCEVLFCKDGKMLQKHNGEEIRDDFGRAVTWHNGLNAPAVAEPIATQPRQEFKASDLPRPFFSSAQTIPELQSTEQALNQSTMKR